MRHEHRTVMQIQDYTQKSNPTYIHFAEISAPFPDWVVTEPTPSADTFAKCASASFADPSRRLLPLATKVAAFYSAIDIFANLEHYDDLAFERVKKACDLFGISADVAPYAELFAGRHEKVASANVEVDSFTAFALDTHIGDTHYRMFPINTAAEVHDSAMELGKMASERRIDAANARAAALNIVDAATEFGVHVSGLVKRLGERRMPDLEAAASKLEKRASYARDPKLAADLYAEALSEAKVSDGDVEELIVKIASIDHIMGIEHHFGELRVVELPHEVVCSGPREADVAKFASENVLLADLLIPLKAFGNIPKKEISYKLTKSAADVVFDALRSNDAKPLSTAAENFSEQDRRTLLRLVSAAN